MDDNGWPLPVVRASHDYQGQIGPSHSRFSHEEWSQQGSRPGSRGRGRPQAAEGRRREVADLRCALGIARPCVSLLHRTSQDPHNVRRVFQAHRRHRGLRWLVPRPASLVCLARGDRDARCDRQQDPGHARTSTTTDLYAHLRASDAAKAAVAVSVAVKQAREGGVSPTACPGGFEPPTNRFAKCIPQCVLTYRFRAQRRCSRPGAYRVVAG